MKSLEQNKPVVVAIFIFAMAIIGYNYFFAATAGSVATQSGTAQTVGNNVLSLNSSLQSVTFDTSLFSTSQYASLVDFTPAPQNEPSGRPNPFAPIGQ